MKRSEAARYAQVSAWVAILLAAVTAGVYFKRQVIAHLEQKKAPPPAPKEVERQSSALTFSKVEGTRTIFTVQASKSTDFRGQDASLLENVIFTSFGKESDRHDVMHTQSCRYAKGDGSIQCSGKVLMDLQSAADAARTSKDSDAPVGLVHIETSAMTFNRSSGKAQTDAPVSFTFPNGIGDGVGAIYTPDDGELVLLRNVHLKMFGSPSTAAKTPAPPSSEVSVEGTRLQFAKQSRQIILRGPTTATTETHILTAGELTMLLDEQFRARTLIATPGPLAQPPVISSRDAVSASRLTADEFTAKLLPEGSLQTLFARGNVVAQTDQGIAHADAGEAELWPRINQFKQLVLRGNVRVDMKDAKTGAPRALQTQALQVDFSDPQPNARTLVKSAQTLDRGFMQWSEPSGIHTTMEGDRLSADFSARGKAQRLIATGGFKSNRQIPNQPAQLLSGSRGTVLLDSAGEWTQINVNGDVRFQQAERHASSRDAIATRNPDLVVMTGSAMVRDATSETHAAKLTFHQASGDVEAEGSVRSTDFSGKSSPVEFAPVPANLTADRLKANTNSGRALYSGHARLWQGNSVLEANSIELLRNTSVLNANGNVRGVFQQVSNSADAAKPPVLWHVASEALTFWNAENRAHLDRQVILQSPDQRMRAAALDLFFTRVPATAGGSSAQVDRAVGTGGVVVEEGSRRAAAEHGVYTSADQKFVLTGGNPTIYDASEGSTSGRELTFYIADDTIIVDSETGKRILSKHRVQQ